MSNFSEYLESYMMERSITSSMLAEESNIERTVIYRYIKGKRIPKEIEIVIHLADSLHMNIQEKSKLIDEYDKLTMGEITVNSYKYVSKLMEKLIVTEHQSLFHQWRRKTLKDILLKNGSVLLNSREEIMSRVHSLFEYAVMKEGDTTVHVIMQPVYDSIQNFILPFFEGTNVKIEQIICLEQSLSKSYKNLEIFQRILPLCFKEIKYKVLYYYDFLVHHINERTWMPNIIMVGDYILQFNFSMNQGIIIKDKDYVKGMAKEYENLIRQTRTFLLNGETVSNLLAIYSSEQIKNGNVIFWQPCMGACISRDLYEVYLNSFPEKEVLIEEMISRHGDWKGNTYFPPKNGPEKIISYCKWDGLDVFMKSGIIQEFPLKFYRPLVMDDRKKLLDRMICLAESGLFRYRFLCDEIILSDNIMFCLNDDSNGIYLNQIEEGRLVQVEVKEQGIYRAFWYYLEYMEKKGMVTSEKESLEKLKRLREKYFWVR